MNLLDILHEIEGEDGRGNLKQSYDLTIKPDEVQHAIDALNNIENYGMYAQNLRNPETIKKIFGPSIPAQKAGAAWKHWDTSDNDEKEEKLADIKSRTPEAYNAGLAQAEPGFEKWKAEGNEGDITSYLITLSGKTLPKDIIGTYGKNYFPTKTPDNLKKYSGKLEQGVHYHIDGDEITFPQDESPFNSRAYLDKVIKTIMDNAGVKYSVVKVEPKAREYKKGETELTPSTPTPSGVTFKVTLDPDKIKGKKKEINALITRLKNTYDKNFEYSNNVITINKVKDNTVKRDLMVMFAPYSKKAEAPINEEYLRMQKLAGLLTESEYRELSEVGMHRDYESGEGQKSKYIRTFENHKIGNTIIDPLDFISSHTLLSNRSKGCNEREFHKYLSMCEDIIERDGKISDYELINIGLVNGFLEPRLSGGNDRVSKYFDHIVRNLENDAK